MQWFATSQITVHDDRVGDQELLVNIEYCGHYKVGEEAGQHYRWQKPFLWKDEFDQSKDIIINVIRYVFIWRAKISTL